MTVSSSLCLSCNFLLGSCADGCAVKLENDEHTFYFNTSRHNDEELIVLECFSVQEAGVYNVYVYEIQYGQVQEYTSRQLENITIHQETEQSQDNDGIYIYNHIIMANTSMIDIDSLPIIEEICILAIEVIVASSNFVSHHNILMECVLQYLTAAVTIIALGVVLCVIMTGVIVAVMIVIILRIRKKMSFESMGSSYAHIYSRLYAFSLINCINIPPPHTHTHRHTSSSNICH